MRRCLAMTVVALAAATTAPGGSAQAQTKSVPCDAFSKNADGSWVVLRSIAMPGAGGNVNLRDGAILRPGMYIRGQDFAAELDRECPETEVSAPAAAPAAAPVPEPRVTLRRLTDANGTIDVQRLTCGQLADMSQEDSDVLLLWYSGWHDGLAKWRAMNLPRVKDGVRRIVAYCKANKDKRIGQAVDVVLKE